MVTGCVIRKCSSVWSPISFTSYHCFPLKNEEMLSKWMSAIPAGFISIPKRSSRICSRHFRDDCFNYSENGKRTLKKDAVPTLFGSDAKKEDILNLNKPKKVADANDSDMSTEDDEKVYRYVKKSKYLPQDIPEFTKHKPECVANCRPIKVEPVIKKVIINRIIRPKISNEEIQLRKQIIVLKKRLLRRDTQIKSIMKAMDSYEKVEINCDKGSD